MTKANNNLKRAFNAYAYRQQAHHYEQQSDYLLALSALLLAVGLLLALMFPGINTGLLATPPAVSIGFGVRAVFKAWYFDRRAIHYSTARGRADA